MARRLVLGLLILGAVGCGSSSEPSRTTHVLDSAAGLRALAPGQVQKVGPFTVPRFTLVTYTLDDMPRGIAADSLNAGISPDATATAADPVVFGEAAGVSSTTQTTGPLEEGAYDLLVECGNPTADCVFTDTVSAVY